VHPPPPRRLSSRHVLPLRLCRRFPGSRWPAPALSTSRRRCPSHHDSHRPQLLLPCDHTFFKALSTSWSFPRTPSCAHTSAFPRDFLFPTTTPRRSTAAASARYRPPPPPPPSHDPVLLEHHCNSLQLTDPPNFPFPHPSVVPRSAGELELHHRSASPSTRRHTAPQPQPRVLAALQHPAEAIQLILHCPPTPQPAERRAAIAAG
jgi:hypothetical protein